MVVHSGRVRKGGGGAGGPDAAPEVPAVAHRGPSLAAKVWPSGRGFARMGLFDWFGVFLTESSKQNAASIFGTHACRVVTGAYRYRHLTSVDYCFYTVVTPRWGVDVQSEFWPFFESMW